MGDLSAFQKNETETVSRIYAYWKAKGDAEPTRGYLGASIIGHDCDRFLWFTFRNCITKTFTGRIYRLFNTGHREEPRFFQELRGIGCEVHGDEDEQIAVSAVAGHFSGHMDAVALGIPEAPKTWHLCEFKTHSSKSFGKLQGDGVKKSNPMHYAQMMVYMGLGKMERALYLAVNKDTDELYSERIEFNSKEFKAIMTRAERIIKSNAPPERCTNRADDFRCKMCDASPLCWGTGETALPIPAKTCRTCCHSTPEMDGDRKWGCVKKGKMQPCGMHLILPQLLTFADPIDAGDDWIKFENKSDKTQWVHGAGEGQWTTEELMKTPAALVGVATKVKEVLGATVVGFEIPTLSLIDRYDPKDSRLLWEGSADADELEPFLTELLKTPLSREVPTNKEDTDATQAIEYRNQYLVVMYKESRYVAVWQGIE
jgi:hypothetical protein